MPTTHSRTAARFMVSPAVLLLLGWMIIPLSMTIYFSFLSYNLLSPGMEQWIGFLNYEYFLTDPAFYEALAPVSSYACHIRVSPGPCRGNFLVGNNRRVCSPDSKNSHHPGQPVRRNRGVGMIKQKNGDCCAQGSSKRACGRSYAG